VDCHVFLLDLAALLVMRYSDRRLFLEREKQAMSQKCFNALSDIADQMIDVDAMSSLWRHIDDQRACLREADLLPLLSLLIVVPSDASPLSFSLLHSSSSLSFSLSVPGSLLFDISSSLLPFSFVFYLFNLSSSFTLVC